MKKLVLVSLLIFVFSARVASAAVIFNEIAWMGSVSSSADEWIELYNTASSTADLTGWKITGKSGATIALLSGNIAPKGYFLIERSDDNTVPGVPADLVVSFGKGIANDGETLKLQDGGGNTVDIATGGKNWSKLGGDNVSKQTAQRTLSGWITGVPTPRAANRTPSLASDIAAPVQKAKVTPAQKVTHARIITPETPPTTSSQTKFISADTRTAPKHEIISTTSVSANVLWQRGRDKEAEKRAWGWMIVAVLLVIVATVVIMRANIYEPTEADKYAIIEDIIEGKEEQQRLGDY